MQPENELPRRRRRRSGSHRRRSRRLPPHHRPPTGKDIGLAIVGGLIGAIVGGVAWGYLVKSTEMELGIAAIGIGVLAGFGVALFARGTGGVPLQVIAAAAAALGILWGKYLAFVLVGRDFLGEQFGAVGRAALPLFSGETFSLFREGFTDLFGGFDVAWIVFAVYTAFRIPAGKGFGRMAPGMRRT